MVVCVRRLMLVVLAAVGAVAIPAQGSAQSTSAMSAATHDLPQEKASADQGGDPATQSDPIGNVVTATGNYTFATSTTGSLADMGSGTTTLIGPDIDDGASSVTPIGFDFYFQGQRYDRFSVNSNGSLQLGATVISNTLYDPLGQSAQALITAYGADQRVHSGDGKVHYKVSGVAPNRVLTVEWLNMQSTFNAGGTADLTYQVRLTETTGGIEFRYGAMTMGAAGAADTNSSSPQIGFSSGNVAGTVGSVTAAQSGSPSPSYGGTTATPVNNLYIAGAISVLGSTADGNRRTLTFGTNIPSPPGLLTFTAQSTTGMRLNWADSPDELAYAIYVSSDGGASFSFVGQAPRNATSYTVPGLEASTSYAWRVFAVSEGALSSASTGTQSTLTPTAKTSVGTGAWSSPATWSPAGIPTLDDAVSIAPGHTVTIDTTAAAHSLNVAGTLQFEQTTARTLTITDAVTVQTGGVLRSNPAGTQTGHNLLIGRHLVNNGTLDFSTSTDTAGATISFVGAADASFSGSGAVTDIRQITVNKAASPAAVVQLQPVNFTVRGVTTDTVAGWLSLSNGTLHLAGEFPGTSRVFVAPGYIIPVTAAFWLDNPNYTVAGQNASPTLSGLLRVSQGTFNVGTVSGNSMGFLAGSSVIIDGGAVNVTSRFGVAAAGNTISYTQSGGTVTVCTIGNASTTLGSFDLGTSLNSTIALSGGTIVTQLAASAIDYRNQAGIGINGVTGGTLQIGNAASGAAKTFNLRGVMPNLVVTNTSAGHTAAMSINPVNFNNISRNVTISPGSSFNAGNVMFLFAGQTFTNDGTLTHNGASSIFVFFDTGSASPQTYSGSGVTTAPMTTISLQNSSSLSLSSSNQFITNRINLFSGSVVNASKITLGNGGATTGVVQIGTTTATEAGTFDVPLTFNLGSGGQTLSYLRTTAARATGPEVNPTRSVTSITVDDNDPAHALSIQGGDLTVAGTVTLNNGRVITGSNALVLGATGTITRTNGYVDGNLRKTFQTIGSKFFEVGTANGYTPVAFNVTAGAFPATVTVASIEGTSPGLQPAGKGILRHWNLSANAITADVTFSYLDPADIPATLTEANLHVLRQGSASASDYSDQGGVINAAANTATVSGVSTFSTWTLGEASADLSITKSNGVDTVTPGGSTTYTITATNHGPLANSAAVVADVFPAGLTCSTTCAGTSGGTCTAGPFAGNINDTTNLPAGGSVTYTSVCSIGASLTGALSNTATVSGGSTFDGNPANNLATDTDTLSASADLAITKTDGVTTATPGGSVTYTITASNAGPSDATGATVADTFPAALTCTWTCVGAGGGTCTTSGIGNINDTVNLPSGGSVTHTASCTIAASASGTLSNTATVAAPAGVTDPTPGNNSATDSDTLSASADLAITKTDGVTEATPGGSVTYTITASNSGPSNAAGATVADMFPAACTNPIWICVGAGGGTCTSSGSGNINDTVNLPSGASATYTATCPISASATGSLINTATVAAPGGVTDPTPGNNSATDTDTLSASADLSITKTDGVTEATPGGSVTYAITASNAGPSDATGAVVADTFPASCTNPTWTCAGAGGALCTASGSGNINDTVNLPSGASVTYAATCPISATASGTLSNTATVAAPAGVTDPTPGNNSATDTDTLGASADLSITKSDGVTTATPGGSVTYTITASNSGPSDATSAVVADTFPASCTNPTWTCAGAGGASCTASGSGNINDTVNLPSGASVTYTATCPISATASGTLSNTATVAAPAGVTDPTPGNNSATDTDTLSASADLSIAKTDGVTTATPGGSVTYTITASNSGPSNATGATVADTFPAACSSPTWTCVGAGGGTCTASGSGNINDTVNLPSGASVTYTATCPISATASGTLSNTATVAAPAGVTDPTPGNNSATDTDTLGASADLSIAKSDGVTTATPGGSVTYTITASNSGPSNATGATVADTFPAACSSPTWTCVGAGGGTCTASGSGNINDTVNLPSGASVTYTATCPISATASGSLINTATVTAPADVTDPTPGNNSATDTDTLWASADLAITKTDGVTEATPGDSVTYTITASNSGPSDATGATVVDTFPAACTNPTWTCAVAGGASCTASGSGNINDAVNLPSGASVTYTATCPISATASGTLVNTATVTAPEGVTDPTSENNSATDTDTLGASADLSITKTDGVATVTSGDTLTYTIVAGNAGPSAVIGAMVDDVFPASCVSPTWTCVGAGGGDCAASGNGNISDAVDLPVAATVTYTAICTTDPATANGAVISNTATIDGPVDTVDPDLSNNSATDLTTAVLLGTGITATKVASGGTTPGSAVTYTIVIANAGPGAQGDNAGDEFIDVLPPQLALVSASASSGVVVASLGSNTVAWNGSIAAGASVVITIVADISPTMTAGTISNQGVVHYDADGNGTNEATLLTDDPVSGGTADPTLITISSPASPPAPVPALNWLTLLGLMAGLGWVARRQLASRMG